ncbi:MAG: choice-of-anchor tandem repeat GloVer-containing protein [Candidatus Sulfotelmatobacter sp.]
MRSKKLSLGLIVALAVFTTTMLLTGTPAAAQERVLHSFGNGKDGIDPTSSLIFDPAGNLYGQTEVGGAYDGGTVFELSPKVGGGWTPKILHSFGNGTDGATPIAGPLVFAAGNLYGTTYTGGAYNAGTVFELKPKAGGGWTEKTIYSFYGYITDGCLPWAGLVSDASGNLYGTASSCGALGYGAVFELSPSTGGYTEKVLHDFDDNGTDGYYSYSSLIFDSSGNLYGTTDSGGVYGYGTVFELTPATGGSWTETVLHSFGSGADGVYAQASLVRDASGNLYGTTLHGGTYGYGMVFELTPAGDGSWTETVLHSFGHNSGADGEYPGANLILDSAGNLYSTTEIAGAFGWGTVFELSPRTSGGWTERLLHSFNDNGKDGEYPGAGLIFDAAGNLYGTTSQGGVYTDGTAFEITP